MSDCLPVPEPSDPATAETYLRLVAEAELRQRPAISGPGPHPHRVWVTAATLAAAGAIRPDVAWRVVSEFEISAGLRSGNVRPVISSWHGPYWVGQHGVGQHGVGQHGVGQHGVSQHGVGQQPATAGAATRPAARARAGRTSRPRCGSVPHCRCPPSGKAGTASSACSAWPVPRRRRRWRWPPGGPGQTRRAAGPRPRHAPFYQVGAIDDRGISYRASLWDMGIEDGRDWWDCHLGLDPAPAPGTRWLEVGPGAQGQRVRIDLAASPGAVQIVTETVPPVSAPARLLDQVGDDLLGLEASGPEASAQLEARIAQILQDLIRSGALRADDPAVLRLAGLGWRLGLDLGLGGPVPARAMPPAWISVLADAHAHDGPDAVASFAADLPEVAGRRFALAGLRSARSGATLHVMATGWEPQGQGWLVHGTGPSGAPLDLSLSWRACDSTGRWHLVSGMSWGMATQTRGMIKMYLTPPLHPQATSLDVILSGPGCRVRATVPLDWGSGR